MQEIRDTPDHDPRRRKRLEKEFLHNEYTLLLEKFGWLVYFFISTTDGKLMRWQIIFFH